MSCHITFERKLQHVGHMWVTSGLFCVSVDQVGQQVRPTFNHGRNPCQVTRAANCKRLVRQLDSLHSETPLE